MFGKFQNLHMSRHMRFLTMWYVRPAKAQTSLRICAVWSEPLLVAWIFYECSKLLTQHDLEFLSLTGCFTGSNESTLVHLTGAHARKFVSLYTIFTKIIFNMFIIKANLHMTYSPKLSAHILMIVRVHTIFTKVHTISTIISAHVHNCSEGCIVSAQSCS